MRSLRHVFYQSNLFRYERETEQNQEKAREFETERDTRHAQALRLHFGEVFLEISIVLASLSILTKRPMLWAASIVFSIIGLIIAATTALVR